MKYKIDLTDLYLKSFLIALQKTCEEYLEGKQSGRYCVQAAAEVAEAAVSFHTPEKSVVEKLTDTLPHDELYAVAEKLLNAAGYEFRAWNRE
jgi:hypothetical protein